MLKKRILVILPVKNPGHGEDVTLELAQVVAPDFEFDVRQLQEGTPFIESRHDEAVNAQAILELTTQAEAGGYHGVFINCFGEPSVDVARELVSIPVVGGFRPAILTARLLAQSFSVVTITEGVVPIIRGLTAELGIAPVSIRHISMHALELGNKERLVRKLVEESAKAIAEDGAEAIVLGCTGMMGVSDTISQMLEASGKPAPVINPATSAMALLQGLIRNGLSHSRLTYFRPTDLKELMHRLHHAHHQPAGAHGHP